jgi:IMP and pyridine-specific 5'-nucleotidase
MVPTVGSFFTPLRLTQAFKEYDACFHISRRKFIPPNFAELRHILNIAQVRGRHACVVLEHIGAAM